MKISKKPVLAFGLIAALVFSSALGGCEPLSEHEKKIRKIEKETARLNRKLGRMRRNNPDLIKPDEYYDKEAIETALKRLDWKQAKVNYERLLSRNVDLGDYPAKLETRMLDQVTPLPASKYEFNYRGYDLLAVIVPDNHTYKDKAALYKNKIVTRNRGHIAKLKVRTDKIEGITWYHHPHDLAYTKEATISFYIGRRGQGQPSLRMKAEYTSCFGWLFAESVIAWHDGIKEPLIKGCFERQNSSISWELLDVSPTELQIEIMRSMAEADEAVLRFNGSKRNLDVKLTKKDKRVLMEVLVAYEAMSILAELEE